MSLILPRRVAPPSAHRPAARSTRRTTLDRQTYERFLPLIRRTAMRLARKLPDHITIGDLIGCGWVGLIEAYQRAEPGMPDHELEAYASYRIRGAMLDYLRTLDPATRDLRRASRKVTEALRTLTAKHNRPPEEEEVAQEIGCTIGDYHGLLQRISQSGLARLGGLDPDHIEIDGDNLPVDEDVSRKQLSAVVAAAIEALPPKLQHVLALYYQQDCTLREIGLVLGVTESRVSQLHSESMLRLRAALKKHG